ncbi:hypothetical protein BaRGS_00032638 [Batillaria attramentaria]|uniref:Isopenicillin N synthase-like Fe(2+) 2OG dioxygenase domain-containing protein n=1 Tax=Batillaria attramentaria TaxID=370345 RepID=A0ABD0JN45_9CAEN
MSSQQNRYIRRFYDEGKATGGLARHTDGDVVMTSLFPRDGIAVFWRRGRLGLAVAVPGDHAPRPPASPDRAGHCPVSRVRGQLLDRSRPRSPTPG